MGPSGAGCSVRKRPTGKGAPEDPLADLLTKLLSVPKAEIDRLEAERPKRSKRGKKPAA